MGKSGTLTLTYRIKIKKSLYSYPDPASALLHILLGFRVDNLGFRVLFEL
jgi:hypothetical protein